MEFKRVPAIDKCFEILELLGRKKESLGITEISNELDLNKSTVFNIAHTLTDLGILENWENKFRFGTKLYVLGKVAEQGSDLIRNIHPYLKEISQKTTLSAFLGIRSNLKALIVDKSDSPYDLKVSSEIGAKIPLVAGAHGKALLSLLKDEEVMEILSHEKVNRHLDFSPPRKQAYLESLTRVRQEGIAYEDEEYLEGIRALAIPLRLNRKNFQAAIWAVGLKNQIQETSLKAYMDFLKEIALTIEKKF